MTDQNYKSIVIVKSLQVIGGCTFKSHEDQSMIELSLLCIRSEYHLCGMGAKVI
jgi:hypothetical protein